MKKIPSSDFNSILHVVQEKYGCESVTSFLERCLSLAVKRPEFFSDVLTGVCDIFYYTEGKHLDV